MRKLLVLGVAALVASFAPAAHAFPWDTDMTDSTFKRAYEWKMMALPEGSVSRNMARTNAGPRTPQADALVNPLAGDAAAVAKGEKLFATYCATCHGAQGAGGAAVADNSSGKRFRMPVPKLAGAGTISAMRTDGTIYATIRNGSLSRMMPGYSWAMSEQDMWSVVTYLRTLEGAAYKQPE